MKEERPASPNPFDSTAMFTQDTNTAVQPQEEYNPFQEQSNPFQEQEQSNPFQEQQDNQSAMDLSSFLTPEEAPKQEKKSLWKSFTSIFFILHITHSISK